MARREVVGAVEHDVGRGHERGELGGADALASLHERISGLIAAIRRAAASTFGRADVVHREQDLPLQVGEVDHVGVDQRDRADARAREELRRRIAEPAGADDQRVRRGETGLRVRP